MARPILHNIDIWPWVVSRYTWELAAQYKADPPMFTRDWRAPLVPLTGDGEVGARSRCGRLLPIHRFAPQGVIYHNVV